MTGTELAPARKQASAGIIVKKFCHREKPPKRPWCLPRVAVKACLDLAILRVTVYHTCGGGEP
jgi:hypothetical protein